MGGRGFAGMTPERRREISSKGGKAAHEKGVAHEWDSTDAAHAGSKGGMARAAKKRQTEPPKG